MTDSSAARNRLFQWGALSVAVVTALVFLNTVRNGFIALDDPVILLNNSWVKNFDLYNMFFGKWVDWFPLTFISFATEHHFIGFDPFWYHLDNLILHATGTLAVCYFFYRITGRNAGLSLLAGLLFGLHPVHVESVAWVTERKDVLVLPFLVGGLCFYWDYLEALEAGKPARGKLAAVIGFFFLALMSKLLSVVFPALLLVLDYVKGRKLTVRSVLEKAPLFAISAVLIVMRTILMVDAHNLKRPQGLLASLHEAVFSFAFYLTKAILPLRLTIVYDSLDFMKGHDPVIFTTATLFVSVSLGAIIAFPKRRRLVAGGFMFFTVALVPCLGITQYTVFEVAERYLYLPSIGVMMILIGTAQGLYDANREVFHLPAALLKTTGVLVAAVLVVGAGYLTYQRNAEWRDNLALWSSAAMTYPDSPRGNQNCGMSLLEAGRKEEAVEFFRRAVNLTPERDNVRLVLADTLSELGHKEAAAGQYEIYVRHKPQNARVHLSLSKIYAELGRKADADREEMRARLLTSY